MPDDKTLERLAIDDAIISWVLNGFPMLVRSADGKVIWDSRAFPVQDV